jgi:hypothetical protein
MSSRGLDKPLACGPLRHYWARLEKSGQHQPLGPHKASSYPSSSAQSISPPSPVNIMFRKVSLIFFYILIIAVAIDVSHASSWLFGSDKGTFVNPGRREGDFVTQFFVTSC